MLNALLTYRLDLAGFAAAGLVCATLAHYWLRQRQVGRAGLPWQAWTLLVALTAAGGVFTEWAGERERDRLQDMLAGIAPTYAQELTLLGHADLRTDDPAAAAESPAYQAMIAAERRWERVNHDVADVYTFRKTADGRVVLVVDAETDYDRNGVYEGEREERTDIGEPYDEATPALLRAFGGEATFDADPATDRWGTTVSAYVPMRDAAGNVEAVLGVDYDASRWIAAIAGSRAAALAGVAVLLVIVLSATSIVLLTRAELAARAAAERERERLRRQLMTASRLAGMAEVATGVLHNVGNVLNSVNVSANLMSARLAASKAPALAKAAAMLDEHKLDLAHFLAADPRGKVLPDYLVKLTGVLAAEHGDLSAELSLLTRSVEHIKQIVAAQQAHAKQGDGLFEPVDPADVIDEALRLNAASLARHGVDARRDVDRGAGRFTGDRHQVLQILVNLISNATRAVADAPAGTPRVVTLSAARADVPGGGPPVVRIVVADTGVGIAPAALDKLFAHGFTTRTDGHGFGLHSAANAAAQMGGRLAAASDGPGRGATFTLELPAADAAAVRTASLVEGRPACRAA